MTDQIRAHPIRIALVGIGKIARDQHAPALAVDPRFAVVATADPHGGLPGVSAYPDIAALLGAGHALDAVSICTPPLGRLAIAEVAIDAGLAVMLEKPPAATVTESAAIVARAAARGVTLFTTWHSREAAAVEEARAWIVARRITGVRIVWKEDIRRWHPGQDWILDEGGFGVFDPGINALSILTTLLPEPVTVELARIAIPQGRASPLVATLALRSGGIAMSADLDFLQTGPQSWNILVEAEDGVLTLSDGGASIAIDDGPPRTVANREYARLYARFADLVAAGLSDVDLTPLRLVEDALAVARREMLPPFHF